MTSLASPHDTLSSSGDRLPVSYERAPTFDGMIAEKDVAVAMRDGVNLSVDIYRPDTKEKLPVLLAFSIYNKDLQGPDIARALPPQPAWSSLWAGLLEAGDTKFFVSRGYIHVIGRRAAYRKSDGGGSRQWDSYDLIEWIAPNPGATAMSGWWEFPASGPSSFMPHDKIRRISRRYFRSIRAARYGIMGSFREEYPGRGVSLLSIPDHAFRGDASGTKGKPGPLPPEKEAIWRQAMANPDYQMYPHVYNVLTQKGQHMPPYFDLLIDPV